MYKNKTTAETAVLPPAGVAARIQAACQRRQNGYTVELAVPLAVILPGGKAEAGQVLHMDFAISDRDEADSPPTPATGAASPAGKPKAKPQVPTTYLTLSGYGKPNYRTHAYVEVVLRP